MSLELSLEIAHRVKMSVSSVKMTVHTVTEEEWKLKRNFLKNFETFWSTILHCLTTVTTIKIGSKDTLDIQEITCSVFNKLLCFTSIIFLFFLLQRKFRSTLPASKTF